MADYDPRDWGYQKAPYMPRGYYLREVYMMEAGGNVWQPMQTLIPAHASPEPFRERGEALGWLKGFRDALRILRENNDG